MRSGLERRSTGLGPGGSTYQLGDIADEPGAWESLRAAISLIPRADAIDTALGRSRPGFNRMRVIYIAGRGVRARLSADGGGELIDGGNGRLRGRTCRRYRGSSDLGKVGYAGRRSGGAIRFTHYWG